MYAARCGDHEVLLLFGSVWDPRRALPQVATYRLARALDLDVVPATTLRSFPLKVLLDAAESEGLGRRVGEEVAVRPDGEVEAAITESPGATVVRGARWSLEQALWARLAESPEPIPPEHLAAVRGYMTLRAMDYLTANVFRKSVEQRGTGPLVLVDNRDGFLEHPEILAVDRSLADIKRFSRFPRGLARALDGLGERKLDEVLQSGDFDGWLVHRRARRELLVRARMLASLVRVRREARGEAALLDD
jgi:hypothetical protein